MSVVDARLHDDVELVGDARIVFPLANVVPGGGSEALPDITTVGDELRIGTFSEREVADLYAFDPGTAELLFPVVLRGEAPALGAPLFASEGGAFAGVVVASETRGDFSLVRLRPVSPSGIFHDLEVAYASSQAWAIDAIPQPAGALQPMGLLDDCSFSGNVGNVFTLTPALGLEVDIDGVLEIRDGDPVPDRFMMLVAIHAELSLVAGLELGGTLQGEIECKLKLAKWDLPFPGYLAPFLAARIAMDSVSAVTLQVTEGPQLKSTAGAIVAGSVLVGFDYLASIRPPGQGVRLREYDLRHGSTPLV